MRISSGSFELLTPRDRAGIFDPQIVKKRQTSLHPELETKILSMFSSGMSYKCIAAHVEEMYDHKISAAEISSITDTLLPVINEWRNRPIQSVYPIVCMDGMFFKVKEDGRCVSKCMYTLLGIDQEGKKEVLGIYLSESEGSNFWLGVLNELKERGVEDILSITSRKMHGPSQCSICLERRPLPQQTDHTILFQKKAIWFTHYPSTSIEILAL